MSKANWDRPSHQIRGRTIENINGRDLPAELWSTPRPALKSKSQIRIETEKLVADFLARKSRAAKPAAPDARRSKAGKQAKGGQRGG